MPVSWINSINPVFVIILSGVFAAIWTKLGPRQPSAPVKFALGAIIMGVAFLLFLPWANGAPNSTPLLAIVLILFVFTIAEMFISPPGLSVTTKLAPERFHTQMVVAVLPVGRPRHLDRRLARAVLRPDERGAVLHDPRLHRDRPRRRAAVRREARARAHEGRALTRSPRGSRRRGRVRCARRDEGRFHAERHIDGDGCRIPRAPPLHGQLAVRRADVRLHVVDARIEVRLDHARCGSRETSSGCRRPGGRASRRRCPARSG